MSLEIYLGMIVGGFFVGLGNVFGQWLFNNYLKKKLIQHQKNIKTKTKNTLKNILKVNP